MKRRGVSYTEILIAVSIFSIGIIPLMFSMTQAFKATEFNSEYSKVLEYNSQLVEEISAMMPTEVKKNDDNSIGYIDLDDLKDEVIEMINARSEDFEDGNVDEAGIYTLVEWDSSKNEYDFKNLEDNSVFRKVEVDGVSGTASEGKIIIKVLITTKDKNGDPITQTGMSINLEGVADGTSIKVGEGSGFEIDIASKDDIDETDEIATPNEEANYVRVTLIGSNGNAGKMEEVWIKVNDDNYEEMTYSEEQSSNGSYVFEVEIDIPANSTIIFKVDRGSSTGRLHKTELKYELHYKNE